MQMRYFYHSFPRPHHNEPVVDAFARGLQILRLIHRYGLILAPEVVRWRLPQGDKHDANIEVPQIRICFTELAPDELPLHATRFGSFALEFDLETLRRLGALPVIYMPQMVRGDRLLSSIGANIIACLQGTEHLLSLLHGLDDKRKLLSLAVQREREARGHNESGPNGVLRLNMLDYQNRYVGHHNLPLEYADAIFSYLAYRNTPFPHQLGFVRLVQNLFYPTDDEQHDELLTYYRQREWRLLATPGTKFLPEWSLQAGGMKGDGTSLARPVMGVAKKNLLRTDRVFWERILTTPKRPPRRRVDLAYAVSGLDDEPIAKLIRRVWVPPGARADAECLFGDKIVTLCERT